MHRFVRMSVVAGAALALATGAIGATGAGAASTTPKVAATTATNAAGSAVTVTIGIDRAPAHTVAVHVATVDGTAHAGRDYTALATTLTFTPTGPRTSTLTIALTAPNAPDGRTFAVVLRGRKAAIMTPSITVVIHPPDTMAQHELVAALAAEDAWRAQHFSYDANTIDMMVFAPGLPWGSRLGLVTDALGDVVCIDEVSASGQAFAVAEITMRANAGIYKARHRCPATPDEAVIVSTFTGW